MTTATQTKTLAAGWYSDPESPEQFRWWNGASWTVSTTPAQPVKAAAAPRASGYHAFAGASEAGGSRISISSLVPQQAPGVIDIQDIVVP